MILSIIIPVYNVEVYVRHCIKSCINLNIPENNYEIIIVNDGSTDKSADIIYESTKKCSNVIVLSQNNAGLSAARNKGLSIAKGDYVWFIDADDWIENSCSSILRQTLLEGYDVIGLGYCFSYESKDDVPNINKKYNNINQGVELLRVGGFPMGAPLYIYSRPFLIKNSLYFYPGIYHEDNEFTPRMLYNAITFKYIDQIVYHYYIRSSGSIISTPNKKKSYDLMVVADSLINFANSIRNNDKHIFYCWAAIAVNSSIRNMRQRPFEDKCYFLYYLLTQRKLFKYFLHSRNCKYVFEGILFISLTSFILKFFLKKYISK